MKRQWIRLYTKVAHDPQVQQMPGPLFKFWINLLCLSGERDDPCIPEAKQLRFVIHLTKKQIETNLRKLEELQLIYREHDVFKIQGWQEHRYVSDISTERVKRFRNAKRNVLETTVALNI